MGNIHFIKAGAGSGKTYRLTEMFCDYLKEQNARPSEFVLTTYTKAAADEFRSKIKAKLKEKKMYDVIPLVESAHIGTIHSVAQSFIEKYWYLLDMSPALSVKEKDEMTAFRSRVLDSVATNEDLEFFYNYSIKLDLKVPMTSKNDEDFWKEIVLDLVDKMRLYGFGKDKLADFKASSLSVINEVLAPRGIKSVGLESQILDEFNALPKRSVSSALKAWDNLFKDFFAKMTFEKALQLLKEVNGKRSGSKPSAWALCLPQDFFDFMNDYIVSNVYDLVKECVERIFAISERLLDRVEEQKRAEGILEFSDLEVLFLRLLANEEVKSDLRASVKYVFVDEFQDVSPIQLKIFQTLGEIVDVNCWVGDPKQAIYGFRGSDTSLVNLAVASLKGEPERLKYSRRSLQQLVDTSTEIFTRAFALLTDSERLEKDDVELLPCDKKIAEGGLYDESYIGIRDWRLDGSSKEKRMASLATKLWNVFNDNKYKVTDTVDDKPMLRDLKYGDVAILTRNNTDCRTIADALRAKGLPVSVLDDKLDDQAEVKLILTLMKYIAGIDTKLTVAELRRLVDDEDLETILMGLAKQNDCENLLQLLDSLKERFRRHSVYDMVKGLIALLDLRHMVCKWSMGQKRQANLDVLASMAASFVQRQKEASVQEFIYYLENKKVEVPFDNTGDTIKVLTYHKSKGLQWKLVLLDSLDNDFLKVKDFTKKEFTKLSVVTAADGSVRFNLFPPVAKVNDFVAERIDDTTPCAAELWTYLVEKKRAEELRLLYVGFTRAENYLVCLSHAKSESAWLKNTRVTFDNNPPVESICNDESLDVTSSDPVNVLPYDNVPVKVQGRKKHILPSQLDKDPALALPKCELEEVAGNIDVARKGVSKDVFGTCIHKYLAVHRWSSERKYHQVNLRNAERVVAGFGFSELIDAEKLVGQADAFFDHIEKKYGKIVTDEHEIPFVHRKDGQVISGEIDLYLKTETGECILVDFKNPLMDENPDQKPLKYIAVGYWPQLNAYRNALREAGRPVSHVYVYYAMLGIAAELI